MMTHSQVLMVFLFVGCAGSSLTGDSTWHSKHGWHSDDFFDDPRLVTLCKAIEAGEAGAVRKMLDGGVDPNSVGKSGVTLLLWAFPGEEKDCFNILLDAGADPDTRITERIGRGKMNTGGTCVTVLAARYGSAAIFRRVLESGADPNAKQHYMERTLVHVILTEFFVPQREEKLHILLEYGPDLNVFSAMDETPAMAAVSRGNPEMALAILNGGADPNIFQPRSPQKLIHFVAREVEIRDAQWKHDHHDALRELIAKLEANGDSLDKATEDIRRWSEIGRNYPPLEGRKILDQEMARIRGETEE